METQIISKTIEDEESTIIQSLINEFARVKTKDALSKIYRHSRVWTRCHYFYAHACTYERYVAINTLLKTEFKTARQKFQNDDMN